MKKTHRLEIFFGFGLIILAASLHFLHYFVFGEVSHLLSFLGKKIAFVPLEVLFITLILHKLLTIHERGMQKKNMNTLTAAFFSEIGNNLLKIFKKTVIINREQSDILSVNKNWSNRDFDRAAELLKKIGSEFDMAIDTNTLQELKNILSEKRQYLLLLLGNPGLIEHETFSDMLWATFHLADELFFRTEIESLPQSDVNHLKNDARRVYLGLLEQWFYNLKHLKREYPYLYSLEMRLNPFDSESNVVINE
ncbi:MAG: hypothetical protein K9K82_12565 [Desulfobacteraceae bacterium]|nr:hypothetical protein [Desulfobacteraceae bacterium]